MAKLNINIKKTVDFVLEGGESDLVVYCKFHHTDKHGETLSFSFDGDRFVSFPASYIAQAVSVIFDEKLLDINDYIQGHSKPSSENSIDDFFDMGVDLTEAKENSEKYGSNSYSLPGQIFQSFAPIEEEKIEKIDENSETKLEAQVPLAEGNPANSDNNVQFNSFDDPKVLAEIEKMSKKEKNPKKIKRMEDQ